MNAIICAALGTLAFYFSAGLGEVWPVAWIAAAPLLWLAYGKEPWWQVVLASFAAFAVGQLNLLEAYGGTLPMVVLVLAIGGPALIFQFLVLLSRRAQRQLNPWLAVFFFPAAWTGWEYLFSLFSANGTFGSFAYSQVGAPFLIQSASLFGLWSITFLICLFSSALALVLRQGKQAWTAGAIALVLFGANAAYGIARLDAPHGPTVRVGVAVNDALNDKDFIGSRERALKQSHAYAEVAQALAQKGAKTVVLPEVLAILEPAWRADTLAVFSHVAKESGARIVAGFNDRGPTRHNIAITFDPSSANTSYTKRHLVPGLEDTIFRPGHLPGVLGSGSAVAICKDMDFPRTISADAQSHIAIMFVPAWDFGADGWAHARMAIMRGVEDGFAMARAAKSGVLTVTNAEGRMIARAPSSPKGFVTLIADVPLGPGDTLYLRIGDVFAWLALALLAGIVLISFGSRKPL